MWIGKTYKIDSAHHLPGHEKCGEVHGHTYSITIEISGPVEGNGMVMDLHTLNQIANKVLNPYDHTSLNKFHATPTCENFSRLIAYELADLLPPSIRELRVKVQEGQGGWAVCHLDDLQS